MRGAVVAIVRGTVRRTSPAGAWVVGLLLGLGGMSGELRAQNIISVPFTNGFVGTRGPSAGTANNVLTYATLGIARTFFIQNSSTTQFELQGNDIPGTLRIVRSNGTTLDIPASANWRNSGGTTYLIGILPRPTSPITFAYSTGSIQITDGSAPGGSSVGGYAAKYAGATLTDGQSDNGNAAASQVRDGLNDYLATVVSSRPAGPVTVSALTTTSTTPTLTGTATLGAGESLSVVFEGVQYTGSTTPAVTRVGSTWSLALASPLAVGTYSVTATITNADGFTLSDATANELVVSAATSTVTLGGSFTANGKTYDGGTAATGTTAGLTLLGVTAPDQVTIASVTLAFQSAAAGTGKTVVITAVTLGGADAARYAPSVNGAPTTTATVTQKALTIGGVAASNRTYDGTTTATLTGTASYVGLAGSESFAVTGTPTSSFATATVGTGKTVTVTGYAAPSTNYTVAQPSGLTASVTARSLTIGGSFTAASRTYDGTATATIDAAGLTLVGVVGGDAVSLTGVTAAFADAAVGTTKPVSLRTASLAGTATGSYTLSLAGAPTTTADITAAATPAPTGGTVTIGGGFMADHKTYDGVTLATGSTSGLTLAGVHAPDQVSIATVTLAFQTPTVGMAKAVMITAVTLAGADAARYTVSLAGAPRATANVTARPLTIAGSFTAASKPYDGTTPATMSASALWLVGVLGGHDVRLATVTAAFADAAVGTDKPVTLRTASLAGTMAGNYALDLAGAPTATASIVAATPPAAPRNVAATPGDGRLAVTWATPEVEGCRAVSGYVVEHSADDGRSWSRTTLAASPTATTLAGLANNVGYRVRVAAVNACGIGAFSAVVGPVVPVAPVPDGSGRPAVGAPGTATGTAGGVRTPVTTDVVQDTIVRVAAGDFTLRLRAVDQPGAAIPVDSTRTLQLEHGGRANADGSGFAPGTYVTLYLFDATAGPVLLGTVPVGPDGAFAATVPVPDALAAGDYTLQVNGIDRTSVARSVAIGVEVVPPPPDLALTATPGQPSPAVGDTITITLTVTNEGRGAAIDVVIPRAFAEPGFTIVHASPLEGTYHAASQEWTIGRLEPGARARMLLTAIVLPPAAPQESNR